MELTIGKRIREMRLAAGMSQEQLAEALCTKKCTISAYETDKIDIKSSILKELATVLHCSASYLLEGNKETEVDATQSGNDGTIYDLWNRKGLPTVTVNYRKRIPREIFDSWYENQNEYHKVDGPATIEEIEEKFILFREAAAMLKMSNEELLTLIRKGKYKDLLEMRMFDNKRWISRRGFQDFLNLHDQYKIRQAKNESGSGIRKFLSQKQYISKEEAARIAGVSKSTVAKWALKGMFPCRAAGYVMRIERIPFLEWVDENRKVV